MANLECLKLKATSYGKNNVSEFETSKVIATVAMINFFGSLLETLSQICVMCIALKVQVMKRLFWS